MRSSCILYNCLTISVSHCFIVNACQRRNCRHAFLTWFGRRDIVFIVTAVTMNNLWTWILAVLLHASIMAVHGYVMSRWGQNLIADMAGHIVLIASSAAETGIVGWENTIIETTVQCTISTALMVLLEQCKIWNMDVYTSLISMRTSQTATTLNAVHPSCICVKIWLAVKMCYILISVAYGFSNWNNHSIDMRLTKFINKNDIIYYSFYIRNVPTQLHKQDITY